MFKMIDMALLRKPNTDDVGKNLLGKDECTNLEKLGTCYKQ